MGQKTLYFKISKRGYKRLFVICFRQVSIQRIQSSIIHIPPCSQEKIDNENPIFFAFFFEDAK
jgi:membrane protein YqaA with SNARE-associated domain